jgi:hypothetical protein
VRHVQHPHGNDRTDEEYNIEPSMIKVEMYVSQDFGDDDSEIRGEVHPHEQDARDEVHAHYLGEDQNQQVAGLGTGDRVEPLDLWGELN